MTDDLGFAIFMGGCAFLVVAILWFDSRERARGIKQFYRELGFSEGYRAIDRADLLDKTVRLKMQSNTDRPRKDPCV